VIAWRRVLLRIVYWLAVLIVSIAILVTLMLLIESRDKSNVGKGNGAAPSLRTND
jgi:hypothetical protein